MQSSTSYEAKVYDQSSNGKILVGTVLLTIEGNVDMRRLSDKATLEELTEVPQPVFHLFDFPQTDLPPIDIQSDVPPPTSISVPDISQNEVDQPEVYVPIDMINKVNMETTNIESLPDFDHMIENFDFELSNDQMEALYEEETVWYPMNSPPGKLGIEVNELGEVRSTNTEIQLMQGGDARMQISKYNKKSGGRVYTVYIYRAGKQKLYDFDLGVEVFKTFNPEYSAYQLKLRYENRDRNDCSLVNLSVDSFDLPSVCKGRSVTEDRVLLKKGEFWMDMVGNGNNILGNYKISSTGIPAYYDAKAKAYLRVTFINSIKNSFLIRINGSSLDLRYVLMRSASPSKYPHSDEHYRIEFKNSAIEYPCFLDNLIVHEGFCINFEWFLNEGVEWKWKCLKPEQKQSKKKVIKSKPVKKQAKQTKSVTTRRSKQEKTNKPSPKLVTVASSPTQVSMTATNKATQLKATAPVFKKKNIKMMSENKFQALRFKVTTLSISSTKKEREMFKEQCVLRKLKRFLG